MNEQVAQARQLYKALLLIAWIAHHQGQLSYSALLSCHVSYIVYSTWTDAEQWMRKGLDSRAWLQLAHHVCTWMLLGVCWRGGPFVEPITVGLLGSVDATDLLYYSFRSMRKDTQLAWLRRLLQSLFAFVWILRRLFVFGENDWGALCVQAMRYYWNNVANGQTEDIAYLVSFGVPMIGLFSVTIVWTGQILDQAQRIVLGRGKKMK